MQTALHDTLAHIDALPDNALLTPIEAAAFLRLAAQTLVNDRNRRTLGIPFVRMGRAIRYPKGEVKAWRESRTVRTV